MSETQTHEPAPPGSAQELLQRQSGVTSWQEFEERIQQGPEPAPPTGPEDGVFALTDSQRASWNRAESDKQPKEPEKDKPEEREARPREFQPQPLPQSNIEQVLGAPPERPNPYTWVDTPEAYDAAMNEWDRYQHARAVAEVNFQIAQQNTAKEMTAALKQAEKNILMPRSKSNKQLTMY